MSDYGEVLKKLIRFTDMKMSAAADIAGYDISYISKWCNKSKLPAARVAGNVNRNLAKAFAGEIKNNGDLDSFCAEFSVSVRDEQLETYIYTMLKEAFKRSLSFNDSQVREKRHPPCQGALQPQGYSRLYDPRAPGNDVHLAGAGGGALHIRYNIHAQKHSHRGGSRSDVASPIRIRIGINTSELSGGDFLPLYGFINKYHYISFDFYDDSNFKNQNLIVVKDRAAVLCSVDSSGRITLAVVITDPEKVRDIYERTQSLFKINHLLIMATTARNDADRIPQQFYAYGDFQMFLARGCEFFLPPEMIEKIIVSAREQGFDEYMEKFFRKLIVTWDDIFSKERADFFILKSTIMKYIENGDLYFTDVMRAQNVAGGQAGYIEHLLDICRRNDRLNFYVIDEEKIPYSPEAGQFFSVQ